MGAVAGDLTSIPLLAIPPGEREARLAVAAYADAHAEDVSRVIEHGTKLTCPSWK